MQYMTGMMRNRSIGLVNREALCEGGFDGWWSPVEKLIGCINYPDGSRAFIAQTLPWDGAVGGRVDTILRYTDHRNKRIVRDFLSTTPTLQPIIGECAKNTAQLTNPPQQTPPSRVVLLSRYRDNIYICLLHFPDCDVALTKEIISLLLGATYGIKLKWEPSSDNVVWGEATLNTQTTTMSLTRKGVVRTLGEPDVIPEWESWTDVCSPHARLVWRSQFPSILQKCVWYALTTNDLETNFRSVLWGVGVKRYPRQWWLPTLRKFHNTASLGRVFSLHQLISWVKQGKEYKG